MAQNNWLTYYPTWIFSYPMLWLQWQRTLYGNWVDIWTKATPTASDGIGQTVSVQQQIINNFLEIEEKSINQSLDMQKMFWQNYFQVLGIQNKQLKQQAKEISKNLEPFPTSAKAS